MGKPDILNRMSSRAEFIGAARRTQGSETSQYLQEKKSTEIPAVAVSEPGKAQTDSSDRVGVVGLLRGLAREVTKTWDSRRPLERATKEGDSPVDEILSPSWKQFPSTAGHVEPRGKPGGPSSKAKYLPATDSALVP
jgi:hypothetical protein